MKKIDFNKWVTENNIDKLNKNYTKGWWEYIEFIRLLSDKIDASVCVIADYEVHTPPPEETIILPLILLEVEGHKLYLKEDFSYCGFFDSWTVSIESDKIQKLDFKNYLNEIKSKQTLINEGFRASFHATLINDFAQNNIFYSNETNKITGTVKDEYDLYALIKFLLIT
jgi:hypothetical protein